MTIPRPHHALGHTAAALAVCLLALTAAPAAAQPPAQTPDSALPDDAVEAYMERLGLSRLLAEQLGLRLAAAGKDHKVALAERLGRMYVALLTAAETPDDRRLWEARGRDLLRDVPEADTSELRLSLNKAVYLRIEEAVERGRLRLAEPAELQEADRQLRALGPEFTEIATRSHRRVETLEKLEAAGDATEALATELSEARRVRSLAFYFAGWCEYYSAYLAGSESQASEALKSFGWLLNSPAGRPATVDRLPRELLRYEHIARAAIGCALAAGLRGNDAEALRWLDAVADAPELPDSVRDALLVRRMIILGDARRWADMEGLVRRTRKSTMSDRSGETEPLPVGPARLLAVITLETQTRVAGPQVEALARTALGDLVSRQEVGQVLDLVRRYGTAPIGDTGFIVHYVRGLLQYDQARDAHKGGGGGDTGDEPSTDPKVANLYQAAGAMLDTAIRQGDAETFHAERGKAAVMLGRCAFYAGDLAAAGDRFTAAWDIAGRAEGGDTAQEALWLAVVSFDRAARAGGEGSGNAQTRLAEAASLFMATYPESPRAARLVLMQAAAGAEVGDDEALRILSDVPKSSPVYEPARRQVARMLYTRFRAARGQERDLAAMRFVGLAEELLAADRSGSMGADRAEAAAASDRLVTRVRQMLDALLSGDSPDAPRAAAVLDVLTGVATYNKLDLSAHEPELTFRRLQIAVATGRDADTTALAERLQRLGPAAAEFAAAADRLVYKRLAAAWRPGEDGSRPEISEADLEQLVRVGARVIDRIGPDAGALDDPAVLTLYSTVAEAATLRARRASDTADRELAITLDETVLRARPRAEGALRRLAGNAELAGKIGIALECWRVMFAASPQGSSNWFEARYESLRLLKGQNTAAARDLLTQHKLLYPALGPEPWGTRLRLLEDELSEPPAPFAPASPAPAPPAPATPLNGGG